MNAEVGVFALIAVEKNIKSSEMLKSIRSIRSQENWKSVLACVQPYSDTSQILVKAGRLTSYSIDITPINFSKK